MFLLIILNHYIESLYCSYKWLHPVILHQRNTGGHVGKFVLHMAVTTGTPTQMYLSSIFQKILKGNISYFFTFQFLL